MDVIDFIHETSWNDLPEDVRRQARRCLLDTLGTGIAGSRTRLAQIVHDFAAAVYGGGVKAHILNKFDGSSRNAGNRAPNTEIGPKDNFETASNIR